MITDKPLTLHILKDEEDDADSNVDSESQAQDPSIGKKKVANRTSITTKHLPRQNTLKEKEAKSSNRGNLFKLASSLKCIPNIPKGRVQIAEQADSLTS